MKAPRRPGTGADARGRPGGDGPEPFEAAAARALADPTLQGRLRDVLGRLQRSRRRMIPPHTATDDVRERARLIRAEVIAHLDRYLGDFVDKAEAHGIRVHLARTAADARRIVLEIARRQGVRRVVKGKSMVSEECEIREALEAEGIEVTETDLGELLVQLARQPPSHLIAPAIHMTHARMAEVLAPTADGAALPPDPKVLMTASRRWLRRRFLQADLGLTGANFGVAETGGFFIVTNEGNGRCCGTLPRVHVAMMGIERVLPTWASVPTILQSLVRSATGQRLSVYVSVFHGPRRPGELHGPDDQHLILVDNGRSGLLGGEFAEALHCIRCGACLNACPIYERAGGHAYQAVYGGPIGKVVTPLYGRSPIAEELPHASSLCGACREACPVKIDIPALLIRLRHQHPLPGPMGRAEPSLVRLAGGAMARPRLYRWATRLARWTLARRALAGWVQRGPGPLADWTRNRDLPVPDRRPFRDRWRERRRGRS